MGGTGRGNRVRRSLLAVAALVAVGTLARPAAAQNLEEYDYTNLGFRAIGAEVLFVDPSQNEGTFGLGVRLDLGFLGPGIRVVPRFGYWKADVNSQSVTELEQQLEDVSELPAGSINLGQIQRSAYVFAADLQYITSISTVSPYVGAGVDVYALNDDGNAISGTFLDDAVVTAGLSVVGGLQFALSPDWSAYGEFRATAVTDASSLGGAFGVYYTFGP